MKIVSTDEAMARFGVARTDELSVGSLEAGFPHQSAYLLPVDTGRKTALARLVAAGIDISREGLFWITGFGIWPSSENMDLFTGYRQYLGETRSLLAAPCHIFSETDLPALETLVAISLYFFWDATLMEGSRNVVIRFSHDERMNVYGTDMTRLREIEEHLAKMNVKKIDRNSQ